MGKINREEVVFTGQKPIAERTSNKVMPDEIDFQEDLPYAERFSFMDRLAPKLQARGAQFKEAAAMAPEQGASGLLYNRPGLRMLGAVAGGINDIVGESAVSAWRQLPEGFRESHRLGREELARTGIGQKTLGALKGVGEYVGKLASEHPEAAKDIEAAMNIAGAIPSMKGTQMVAAPVGRATLSPLARKAGIATVPQSPVVAERVLSRSAEKAVDKALLPTGSKAKKALGKQDFYGDYQKVGEAILERKGKMKRADGTTIDKLPEDAIEQLETLDPLKRQIWEEVTLIADNSGATVDVAPIKKRLEDMLTLHPDDGGALPSQFADIRKALKELSAFEKADGGAISFGKAQRILSHFYEQLKPHFRYKFTGKGKEMKGHFEVASMLRSQMEEALDMTLASGTGQRYTDLRNTYKAIKTIEDDVLDAAGRELNRRSKGKLGPMDVATSGGIIYGLLANKSVLAASGASAGLNWFRRWGADPNRFIKKYYKQLEATRNKHPKLGGKYYMDESGKVRWSPEQTLETQSIGSGFGDIEP